MRNTLARQFANEARRGARMSKLEKKNREYRVASMTLGAFISDGGVLDICGVPITNVRFTDKGCSIDLADGGTIAIRITAYGAD